MEENQVQPSRMQSIIRFAIVGVILVLLLLAGLYFGKKVMNAEQAKNTPNIAKVSDEKPETSNSDKKIAEQRALNKKATAQKAAEQKAIQQREEAKKTEEAKKVEEKRKADAAAAAKPEATPTVPAPTAPTQTPPVASTTPIPSTGPVEVVSVLFGLTALSYGSFIFFRSKHELTKVA